MKKIRVCIWMRGKTGYTDYDLWEFRTDKSFDLFMSDLFDLEIYIGEKSALRMSEVVKMSLYDKPDGEGYKATYY